MLERNEAKKPARTLLEQLIRQRQQTFEEFAEYAGTFAREHGEPGTLSVRHLQRLVAGRQSDGSPLGPMRPATARLLQRIFGMGIGDLLSSPAQTPDVGDLGMAEVLRVAVAVVVKGSAILIVCRRGDNASGISWQFPAGMIKPGMPPARVAVQETLAETAVHCTVQRQLGRRLHPVTSVLCEYLLCTYLTGDAANLDVVENVGVTWVDKTRLTDFIPADQIFAPVLEAIQAIDKIETI